VNQTELEGFLQFLANYEFQLTSSAIIAIVVFLILVVVYWFLRRRGKLTAVAGETSSDLPKSSTAEPTGEPVRQNSAAEPPRRPIPQHSAAESPRHAIPQDSVLRRHYVTHARYMIETIAFPRPTDSVLCRHYDHLIESELDACLADGEHMERLISRYEAHRRNARS